jgi:hypothetical protein
MSKAAHKRNAGLTVVTQDVTDVLGTDLGQAVVPNPATQVLLKAGIPGHRRRGRVRPDRQATPGTAHRPDPGKGS